MNDEVEQAFREGYIKGYSNGIKQSIEDKRIKQIAEYYGYEPQREQFEEECAEAILASQKCKRYGTKDRFVSLCEEVADVLIMAWEMRLLMSPRLIDEFIEKKLDRQIKRIEDEKQG